VKKYDDIAVVKSEQKWSIFGKRENVIQLLENICTIVTEQEQRRYNLKVTGYIEKQAKMFPAVTQLADISIQPGQFVSFNDRFDGMEIQNSYSLLLATFDQETGSDEWSRGEITFPIYEIINISGNEQSNVMAPFEKVIERWQNIIINNIDNDDSALLGCRKTSISIIGSNDSLRNFLINNIVGGIIPSFEDAEVIELTDDENIMDVGIYVPTEKHTLVESLVRGKERLSNKLDVVYFNLDANNEIGGMNRIYFEFNTMTLAFDEENDLIDIAEDEQDLGNAISNELMKYI
jgi:hypothetical protein